jgi:hypothetical protein
LWKKGGANMLLQKNANGKTVWYTDPNAVCWCMDGAISAAYRQLAQMEIIYNAVWRFLGFGDTGRGRFNPMVVWNDAKERTQQEVVNVLKTVEDDPTIIEAVNKAA